MMRKKELLLLSCLRSNDRETLTSISKMIRIPISTIFDKLKEYEGNFIRKHTCLVDFKKLGYDIKIHLMIKIDKNRRSTFENFIMDSPSVNNVYRINNGYDYFIEGIFRNINEFQLFADRMESFGVKEFDEHFVIDELKRENFLSDRNYVELIM